jgi:glycosyltransferase involved in cell wall biosynthesis
LIESQFAMRILFLTPGTGSFYCGTCLRDNALASALRKQGHDALMIPLYLPPTLDEENVSPEAPLFYGGVNSYLQQKSGLFRKTPRWIDKLLDTPAVLKIAAGRAGSTQPEDLGDMTLSMLRGEDGNQAKELDRLVEWLRTDGKADVICLSNVLLMGLVRRLKRETGAFVAVTLQGEDSFLDSLPEPERTQSWQTLAERAQEADAFIAPSRYYADVMTERCQLPKDRVHVVPNGILLDGYPTEPRKSMPDPPVIGFLSRMCPPKGLHTLVDAFLTVKKSIPNAKLCVIGTQTDADVPYVEGLRAKIAADGYGDDVSFHPNVSREEKIRLLQTLSVLSVPAMYGESFGLYVIESMAAGVPVVQPDEAAFPEILGNLGVGAVYNPEMPDALAKSLVLNLTTPEIMLHSSEIGRRAVREKYSVERMADGVMRVFTGNSARELEKAS